MQEVISEFSLSRCDITGHSMGGFLALNSALVYPEMVNKRLLYAPDATKAINQAKLLIPHLETAIIAGANDAVTVKHTAKINSLTLDFLIK